MTIRDKLAAVKASVKMVDLLRSHGISVPEDTQTQISCPFHGPDNHPSARVYANTNTIFCWTCHKLYDVIAAEMHFAECTIAEAIDALVSKFAVSVEAQPQEIQRFYTIAAQYVRGDPKQVLSTVSELGDKFRVYYTSLADWRLLEHLIDYFWQEYDELQSETPAELLDLAVEWFARAHAMIAAQVPTIVSVTASVEHEELDEGV